MKWTYSIKQKIKAAFSLGIVFVLVLTTNLIDRNHFSDLQESFSSVYKDRLLVENYIFKLSGLIHNKHMLLHKSEGYESYSLGQKQLNSDIDTLLVAYEKTKYTQKETELFRDFKITLEQVRKHENEFDTQKQSSQVRMQIESKNLHLITLLEGLSRIQMEEGEKLIAKSTEVINASHSISRLEIVIVIVIGVFAQVLVLASKTLKPNKPQKFNLN